MSSSRCTALLIVFLALHRLAIADESADEGQRLAGSWRGTGGSWAGKALTAEQARQCVVSIAPANPERLVLAPQLSLSVPDGVVGFQAWSADDKLETRFVTSWQNYNLGLDPATTPRSLTAFKLNGLQGHGFSGIYRIEADELTVCLNFDRAGQQPSEFKAARGSEVLLLRLKRSK